MNKTVTLLCLVALSFSIAVTAAEFEHDVNNLWMTPHNFLQPDYFVPNPNPIAPLDDTLNVRINSDNSGQIQNEQQLRINPTDPNNVVAVWRDFRLGYRRVGIGRSTDGGYTWTDELFDVYGRPWHSDPGLTNDVNGNFYAVTLAYEPDQSYSGFEVWKSSDGGATWGTPTLAIDGVPNVFEDKELMACDRAPDSPYQGSLYIAWTRFWYPTNIKVIRSTDGNITWTDPVNVSDWSSVQWPVPVVGAGGIVYIAWVSYYDQIKLDRSFDGGATWGSDITISNIYTASDYINGSIWVFSFPALDADITGGENHGNLYVAYMDRVGSDNDIYFRRSTNQGSSWSSPVRLNDDTYGNGRDQFHPWLVVDENGVITVMFYDRRLDPGNLKYDIYLTQSFDAGATWTENVRVTTVSSDPSTMLAGLIGEYSGLDVRNGIANLAWTDWRNGDQDTYGARLQTYTVGDLAIDMIPDDPPISVPPGGSFTYTGVLTNNSDGGQTTDVWIMLDVPDYGMYGPLMRINNIYAAPNQTLTTGVTQNVPGFAPSGAYKYIAYCGDFQSTIEDSTWFEFTVTGQAESGPDEWNLSGWFGQSSEATMERPDLLNCYPNPFNVSTTISYTLERGSDVRLEVYNVMGQRISMLVNQYQASGEHNIIWDASEEASGLYFYRLTAEGKRTTRRMVLLK